MTGAVDLDRLSVENVLLPELRAAIERKDGYIMGARGQNPRTGYLDLSETKCKSAWEVSGWYYTQYLEAPYTAEQYQQALYWREHATRVWDCNGLAEGIYELHTGVNIDSKARFNYSEWCNPRGANMNELPRVAGVAVFMHSAKKGYITHVGYLLEPVVAGKPEGDWWVCEARGVMYGVVKTKLSQRGWNRWGVMSRYYDYGDALSGDDDAQPYGTRLLKRGCSGSDVKALQETLISLGYDCGKWGADGDFGSATRAAVIAFQQDRKLAADGIVGDLTKAALLASTQEAPDEPEYQLTIKGSKPELVAIQELYGGVLSEVSE